MARANLQRQIQVASREAWTREFREQVAGFLGKMAAYTENGVRLSHLPPDNDERREELLRERCAANDARRHHLHVIRLLIAEKEPQDATFIQAMGQLFQAPAEQVPERAEQLTLAAETILQRERASIEAPGRRRLWVSQQLRAWLRRILTPPSRW